MIRWIQKSSPTVKARVAGGFYLLAVLSAVFVEAFVRGSLLYAAGLVPVVSFGIVTLVLYHLLKPVNRGIARLAAFLNLVSLTMEALEFHFMGANVALIFHGLYCLLIGFLVLRSNFLARILGIMMVVGGLAWLTDLSIPLTNHLAPYNLIAGFIGEGTLMLWLLLAGLNDQRWNLKAGARAEPASTPTQK